jgi:Rrf2 family iron-sulfur cluster assembly transcriptional regulator
MILSKSCDYGIRSLLYVASQNNRHFIPIREISEKLNISFYFLTKILLVLSQKNITLSFRGPNGGIALSKPAEEIPLIDIISALDGPDLFQKCVLGLAQCGDDNPCPLHNEWTKFRAELQSLFQTVNLANLARRMKEEETRITDLI